MVHDVNIDQLPTGTPRTLGSIVKKAKANGWNIVVRRSDNVDQIGVYIKKDIDGLVHHMAAEWFENKFSHATGFVQDGNGDYVRFKLSGRDVTKIPESGLPVPDYGKDREIALMVWRELGGRLLHIHKGPRLVCPAVMKGELEFLDHVREYHADIPIRTSREEHDELHAGADSGVGGSIRHSHSSKPFEGI